MAATAPLCLAVYSNKFKLLKAAHPTAASNSYGPVEAGYMLTVLSVNIWHVPQLQPSTSELSSKWYTTALQ